MKMTNLMEMWKIESLTSYGIVKLLYDIINGEITPEPGERLPILPTEDIAKSIDNYYYFGWSGDKWSSPLVEKINKVDELHMQGNVARMFWNAHGDELLKEWNLFTKEYDPLRMYDVHEETDYTHSGSGEAVDDGDDKRITTGKVSTTDSLTGVNGSAFANADKSITDYSEESGNPLQVKTEYGKTRTTSESATDDLDIHKYGLLGTTPLTKLVKDDIELWMWDFYTRILFPAIDSMIALPIY